MYYYNNELPPQQGWICPKCGRVNAPWLPTCGCVSSQTSGSGTPYLVKTSSISRDNHEIKSAEQTEPQIEKCPFDDSLPCEWVCTEYGKCKYKYNEPQTDCLTCRYNSDECDWEPWQECPYEPKTEPQTEMEKSGSRAVQTARCLNCHNAKDCKENHWEVCKYEPWKLTAVDDEPQTDIGTSDTVYSDTGGYVPRVDMTDCSWKKGE